MSKWSEARSEGLRRCFGNWSDLPKKILFNDSRVVDDLVSCIKEVGFIFFKPSKGKFGDLFKNWEKAEVELEEGEGDGEGEREIEKEND